MCAGVNNYKERNFYTTVPIMSAHCADCASRLNYILPRYFTADLEEERIQTVVLRLQGRKVYKAEAVRVIYM